MGDAKEIYCYADPDYEGDLSLVLALVRERGHRVLVGADVDELSLLLELSRPSAVVYTLPDEGATLSVGFQEIAAKALAGALPIILVGPEEPEEGVQIYLPREGSFEQVDMPLHALPGFVDELDEAGRHPGDERIDRLVDVTGDDPAAVRVETSIVRGEEPRIVTAVSQGGQVVVREEQPVDLDDPEMRLRIELQHRTALRSYQPARPSQGPLPELRGEVSRPITLPPSTPRSSALDRTPPRQPAARPAVLLLAALLTAAAALYLSSFPTTPLPIAVTGPAGAE